MTIGAGRYDDECTKIREELEADGVLLIVINGNKRDGFSVQAPFHELLLLPTVLRHVAYQIEADMNEGKL